MNRETRRKRDKEVKGQAKQKFTLLELQKAISISLEMKKASRGHLFSKNLKERCVFCGVTRRTKKECEYWFLTFLDRVQTILINPQFFSADDIEAIWLQHAAEYASIQIPLVKADDA
jgi:hypothetical protein